MGDRVPDPMADATAETPAEAMTDSSELAPVVDAGEIVAPAGVA